MDIRAISPTLTAPSAPKSRAAAAILEKSAPVPKLERKLRVPSNEPVSNEPVKKAAAPKMAKTHAELAFDETINRVVGRVVNENTGQVIHEIPPAELRALYTKTREQLGPLVDEKA